MTTTAVIQIGNSDNRLSQRDWSEFIQDIKNLIAQYEHQIHFQGGSGWDSEYQNACFVVEIYSHYLDYLISGLRASGAEFGQDSIALTVGETRLIRREDG